MDSGALKNRLPQPVADQLRPLVRRRRLARNQALRRRRQSALRETLADIRRGAPELPARAQLERLSWAWSNSAAGDVDYLADTVRHARDAAGPILECGSGLTTLLLGIYAHHPVVTLENHPQWADQVGAFLTVSQPVELRTVPLRQFDGFTWYDVAPDTLPTTFALVICDGPPLAEVAGGRVGLLPVLDARLPVGTVFLLDEHMQSAERAAIDTWERDYGLSEVPAETTTLILRRG